MLVEAGVIRRYRMNKKLRKLGRYFLAFAWKRRFPEVKGHDLTEEQAAELGLKVLFMTPPTKR